MTPRQRDAKRGSIKACPKPNCSLLRPCPPYACGLNLVKGKEPQVKGKDLLLQP
jgi:hypothetical protein